MARRFAPAVCLFLLAPFVGEYLIGSVSVVDLAGLLVLAPMYGGGALLIREVTRRTGRGWPTIVVLGAAYGLLESGLLDQSLFNPTYYDYELLEQLRDVAYIKPMGISAYLALSFVIGHAIWSISVPIALIEAAFPGRSDEPWLSDCGLTVVGATFLAGSAIIFYDHQQTEGFLVSPPQGIGVILVILALLAVAFAVGRPTSRLHIRAPDPRLVGVTSFVACSLFFALIPSWLGVAEGIALVGVALFVVARWSRRDGWDVRHRVALAGGALLTSAWGAFTLEPFDGPTGSADVVSDTVVAVAAVGLLAVAARAAHRAPRSRQP